MPIISLQISEELHEKFEKIRIRKGIGSKSEALRYAIVEYIESLEKFEDENPEIYKIVNISLVYPMKELIINELSEAYSQFHRIIKTITDWRIAEKKIEILIVVGELGLIKDLLLKIAEIKEVKFSIREVIIE